MQAIESLETNIYLRVCFRLRCISQELKMKTKLLDRNISWDMCYSIHAGNNEKQWTLRYRTSNYYLPSSAQKRCIVGVTRRRYLCFKSKHFKYVN